MKAPPGTDNFEVDLVSSFEGYASSIDPTNASSKVLIQGSKNVYKKSSGTYANRPGRKLYDATTDSTLAGIKSGFVWNTSLGASLILRVANSKLQVYSTVTGAGVWYDLMTSLSKTRFVFDSWWHNNDKKDKLLFVIGDANIYDWSGGIAKFVSATSTVITLDRSAATAGFASSGTVVINSNTYTYTGISGSTLTGAADASAETANSIVIQQVVTQSNATPAGSGFACDFAKVIGNQYYVGSYSSRVVYTSKNSDYKDFAQSTPRLPGEGNTLTLDDTGKGIGVRQGVAHIFGGTSSLYIIEYNQVTIGASLTENVNVSPVRLGNLVAAQAHEFIDVLSDNIVYLDQANQLRSFGSFRNISTAKAVLLSQAVQDELAQETFTLGQLKVISDRRGDIVYIMAPVSGIAYTYWERTGLDAIGNVITQRYWQPPLVYGIARIDSIAGSAIGFSNSNPQIYYIWETNQWHDDSPSGQLPYACVALFAYKNGGRRQGKIAFEKLYVEGYATAGSDIYGGVYYDYQGSTALLSPIISDATSRFTDKQLFTGVVPPSLGDASLGDVPLGDGINILADDQSLMPKFRVICGVEPKDCFEFALMIYSNTADARWEILALGVNEHLAISAAVEIVK